MARTVGLFGPKFLLDDGTTNWIFDSFAWALESFGSDVFYQHTELVLPNDTYFPDKFETPEDVAETIFNRVRRYAGMEDWPCRLVAQKEEINPKVGSALLLQGLPKGPAGTFSISSGKHPTIEISYDPTQINQPEALIATFAHELAHYLMASVENAPPGGDQFEEQATDLVAVFMGFGVFLANSAFTFSQYADSESQGWQTTSLGYLTETEFTYCLAVFLQLKEINSATVDPHLDKHLMKTLNAARKEMNRSGDQFTRLRTIQSKGLAKFAS